MVYLDNSATTKPCPQAVEAITRALTEQWGNPSALYSFGIDAARELRGARHQVAAAMGAEPERVFFTSGGTEADNWAVMGAVKRLGKRGRHIVTTAMEHHAILNCMQELEAQGFEVTYLKPDGMGRVSTEDLKAALRRDTILVSVMMVNNEVGSVMPIAQMAKLTHRLCPDAIFHTDAGLLKGSLSGADAGGRPDQRIVPQNPRTEGSGRAVHLPPAQVLPSPAAGRRTGGRLSQRHRGNAGDLRFCGGGGGGKCHLSGGSRPGGSAADGAFRTSFRAAGGRAHRGT